MPLRFLLASLVAGLAAIGVIGATVSLIRVAGFEDYYQEEGLFAVSCGIVGLLLLRRAATQSAISPLAVVGSLLLATSIWRFLRFGLGILELIAAGENTVALVAIRVLLSLAVLAIALHFARSRSA